MLWGLLSKKDLKGKNILITAGPTAEDIDPVRFITNRSTGKMGISLAEAAVRRGASVILILGAVETPVPKNIKVHIVRSAEEMYSAVMSEFKKCNIYISAAAIADYTPIKQEVNKIKKRDGNLILELKRTKDILQEVAKVKSATQKIIGFSIETTDLVENSLQKLKRKNLDLIVANNPKNEGAGFGGQTNQVEIITEKDHETLPLQSKLKIAHAIYDKILMLESK